MNARTYLDRLAFISTRMAPILIYLLDIFSSFFTVALAKLIGDDNPATVNFSMFAIYFSLRNKDPNLRSNDFKQLPAAIFERTIDLSATS